MACKQTAGSSEVLDLDIRSPIGLCVSVARALAERHRVAMRDDERHVDEYLTPETAATLIGRSVAWVWRAARDGRLRAVRVVGRTRFRRRDVEALLAPVER